MTSGIDSVIGESMLLARTALLVGGLGTLWLLRQLRPWWFGSTAAALFVVMYATTLVPAGDRVASETRERNASETHQHHASETRENNAAEAAGRPVAATVTTRAVRSATAAGTPLEAPIPADP